MLVCDDCGKAVTQVHRCPTCGAGYCSKCKDNIDTARNNCKNCNNN